MEPLLSVPRPLGVQPRGDKRGGGGRPVAVWVQDGEPVGRRGATEVPRESRHRLRNKGLRMRQRPGNQTPGAEPRLSGQLANRLSHCSRPGRRVRCP